MHPLKRSLVLVALALASACSSQARAALKPGDPAPDFTAQAWLAGEAFEYSLAEALRALHAGCRGTCARRRRPPGATETSGWRVRGSKE